MWDDRLERQIRFIAELDRLKHVLRRTPLTDGSRRENSAEHSWHVAAMAPLVAEYCRAPVDLSRVVLMLLVHDVVEIDAGDTFCYDADARLDEAERERRAADRLFALLPDDQCAELLSLWEEFSAAETHESRFAHAVDRLQPLIQNLYSGGGSWRTHRVTRDQVLARMQPIRSSTPELWPFVEHVVAEGVARGFLL